MKEAKKRKLIDISDRTGKILGMMAVQEDMSLKAYIESLLDEKALEIANNSNFLTWKEEKNSKQKSKK